MSLYSFRLRPSPCNGFTIQAEVRTFRRTHTMTPLRDQEQQPQAAPNERPRVWRSVGLGIVTGAADDDPSAVGTYASVGATLGMAFLWIAPAVFPMMFAVVY